MLRHGFILADDAQRKAEPRAGDEEADEEHGDGQRQQLPVDIALGDIDEHVTSEHAGFVDLEPDHELSHQFGKTEGEDHEVRAAEPQRRRPTTTASVTPTARRPPAPRPAQRLADHRDRVRADAEERVVASDT